MSLPFDPVLNDVVWVVVFLLWAIYVTLLLRKYDMF